MVLLIESFYSRNLREWTCQWSLKNVIPIYFKCIFRQLWSHLHQGNPPLSWLFPTKISPNPFMKLRKQDISASIYNLSNEAWKLKCWKLNSISIEWYDLDKKNKVINHCRVMVQKKQHCNWSVKYVTYKVQ